MRWLLIAFALTASLSTQAAIVEAKRWVSVKALDTWGHEVTRDIMVTMFYEGSVDGPRPVAIINHGRAATADERKALGRATHRDASLWFVKHGYFVAVPTRIGYGVTGGPDIEDTGGCNNKNYAPGYAASAAQTLAVLRYLRSWAEAATDRVLMVGQSFGGTTAITIAAMNVPGVQAGINFAGGGGGRPKTHPGNPCSPHEMRQLFEEYGRASRIPTLWIYSENDEYFGPKLPREWFKAFRDAGGNGEFVQLPPLAGGGHGSFGKAPASWQPKVEEFLGRVSGDRAHPRVRRD
jgi:dienelactone hydrolase